MPNKYRVKEDGIKISGTLYNAGDIVELTDEVAEEIGDGVELDQEASDNHTHHQGDKNFKGSEDPGNTVHPVNPDGESANDPALGTEKAPAPSSEADEKDED